MTGPGEPTPAILPPLEPTLGWPTLWGSLLGLAIALGWTAFSPPVHQARASLVLSLPAGDSQGMVRVTAPSSSATMALYGFATSDNVLMSVAKAMKLPLEEARGRLAVSADIPANQVIVAANDGDPKRAAQMVTLVLAELERLNREIGFTLGSRQAAGLYSALKDRKEERKKLLASLTELQKQQKAPVSIAATASATVYLVNYRLAELELVAAETRLTKLAGEEQKSRQSPNLPSVILQRIEPQRQRMLQAELAYRNGQTVYGPKSPELAGLKAAFDASAARYSQAVRGELERANLGLSEEASALQAAVITQRSKRDFWRDRAEQAPEEAKKLIRLESQIATLDRVVATLEERYQLARIQSAVDRVQWAQLGPVSLAPEPINRTYIPNGLVGLVLGGALGVMFHQRRRPR